ncbi:hypothetical protein COU78_06870 [Candidatus Peregrinibacteria bacterium CG10_big_fil_rev_8_21_14_0_10_49_24]|nr:MAG: hypothetical protein COV83_01365 [Candidatus Peregrinibacteria bacterium CG11_big_fil_rev_8_21_14_0_20_49_14]PIR50367.1 MAG: hypothetical protein COU78_06870 [Candidatus Peregrinibacteria bacterium CG10_big_fil_rev_8_21_14_0_10_49_24]
MQNPFSGIQWNGRKTAGTIITVIVIAALALLMRGGGEEKGGDTPPVPNTTTTTTTTATATDTTLLQDLEYVAGSFPGLQLNTGATPYTCAFDVQVLDDETTTDIQEAVKDEMKRDGITLKEVTLQKLTIVLNQESNRFSGFIVRITGKRDDDTALAETDVFVGDGTWTEQRSAEFAKSLRASVEGNPLYSGRATGGGHRVRLGVKVPVHRAVNE